MSLATAIGLAHPNSPAAWLAARGLGGSTFGGDYRQRRYWAPAASPAMVRWASEAEHFAQFTASAGRAYMDAAGILRADVAANQPRFTYVGGVRRLMIEGQVSNKVTARKHNPVDLTNVTAGGDVAATLSIVNDTAALAAAGLSAICTNGAVYRLDNSAGASAAYAVLDGPVGNTNPHVREVYARGSGDIQLQYSGGSGLSVIGVTFNLAPTYQRCTSAAYAPTAATQRLVVYAQPGAMVYFILPGLYDRAAPAALYPVIGDTASGVTQASESFRLPAAVETGLANGACSVVVRPALAAGVPVAGALFSAGAGTEADRWQLFVNAAGRANLLGAVGGVTTASAVSAGAAIAAGEPFGAAAAIAGGDYAVDDSKGALATSTAPGALPTVTRAYLGRRQDGGATGHGLYDLFALWPVRLPDARIQALAVAA